MTITAVRDLRTLADAPLKQELISALQGAGRAPLTLNGESGETVLVLPQGGRVLGLYSSASEKNFLWTSAAISNTELAREHFASDRWCNSGGDRTWLAPEIDFFYPHYPDTGRQYLQPRQLDPGRYVASRTPTRITLENALAIHSFRRGWTHSLRIRKTVRMIANPLACDQFRMLAAELEFAGYSLETSLELLDDVAPEVEVGIWNLLQLPGGGEMVTPTYGPTTPFVYFGDIPNDDLKWEDGAVRYRMSAPNEQKIGVDAIATTGRAGYFLNDDDSQLTSLVVRNFNVNVVGPYADVPLHRPKQGGHAFQACNIDADFLGRFAELEYHAPAIGGRTGLKRSDDVSHVFAYRGPRELVAMAARTLLGVRL